MPELELKESRIHYEIAGKGYPVFLLAPGFLSSRIERWSTNPARPDEPQAFLDPIEHLRDRFQLISLDIRNAGQSRGRVGPADSWHSYVEDFLALLDHLQVKSAHVMGACIGVSFAFGIAAARPDLVSALVLQNPIGLHENRDAITAEFDSWAKNAATYPEVEPAELHRLYRRMFANDFLFAVSRETVSACRKPILLFPGDDVMHPKAISEEIARLAPNVKVRKPWKGAPHNAEAMAATRAFLIANDPSRDKG